MDAQNAVEPASTKPAASPKRPSSDLDHPKSSAVNRPLGASRPDLSLKENNRPITSHVSATTANDDDGAPEGNSDAETIVLPGRDGHSPSKVRKIIKHEDKSDGEDHPPLSMSRKHSNLKQDRENEKRADRGDRDDKRDRSERPDKAPSGPSHGPTEGALREKKKKAEKTKPKDGSSGLSSAPTSPPQRRRRSSYTLEKSDSETAQSPKMSAKEKPKSLDKLVPHKRKAPKPDSDDEAENRKIRRQRISGSGLDASRKHHTAKPQLETHQSSRNRSVSPHLRTHRRSISTQLPGNSSNGLSHKKKRIPAPLQSTDYHSDDSSASGSPHPRSSKLRSLATPATADSTVSPAKVVPHKKHLDAHGQTFLARACAKGEYEIAKQRLQERPEDINVADYAGNTPLQIAALNGFDDIVKLLVDAGCNLDCVNNDKDTPLLDAVENGNLEVVKILLAAGVNPRKANAYGQEPIDRVNDDMDHPDEIRRALREARMKMGERRRTSEDHHPDHTDARSSHGPESPRRSPGATASIHASSGRRAGTVRATKTANHLLYMPMDDKTLRAAAARGDEETVTRILQVRDSFDDPESMVAAARGGHEMVMQLLLALGKANPDPAPISNNEYSTPILAAIGQENLKVIKLLLDQNNFDPTRRFRGETYYDIARRRRGPNWIEEEQMLKDAYDAYKSKVKESSKTKSPNKREREAEREPKRSRAESKDEPPRPHKRKPSSPTREPKKATSAKVLTSPKDKRRSASETAHQEGPSSPKRGPGRPKKEDRIPTIAISDREGSPVKPSLKPKRAEPDLAAASSEGETPKPRRKLVSGRELKGEREKQRRASINSNTSSLNQPSSPREEPEKVQKAEKYHDRTKALKRDESRDRLSVSGDNSAKRHRTATPPQPGSGEKDNSEGPAKRRRLDGEAKERRLKPTPSDERHLKTPSRDPGLSPGPGGRIRSKSRDDDERKPVNKIKKVDTQADQVRRVSEKSASSEGSIHVKSEDPDIDMPDADRARQDDAESRAKLERQRAEEEKKKQTELEAAEAREKKRREEEAKKREEERKRRDEEEKEKERERVRVEEEAKRVAAAEAESRRREEEEQKRKAEEEQRRVEEERKRKEEEDRKQRELEERRRREEEERRRAEEEERKRKDEERKKKEAEERKQKEADERKRQEEERKRKEQLAREAAEAARKKREEEERLEQARREQQRREQERREHERKERELREEQERKQAAAKEAERAAREAREADLRRQRLEQEERIRVSKLPPLLRWLDGCSNPKIPEIAEKFRTLQGVRYDCIRTDATGSPQGREQWVLNTQVALLLGEKDLKLSRCKLYWPCSLHFSHANRF